MNYANSEEQVDRTIAGARAQRYTGVKFSAHHAPKRNKESLVPFCRHVRQGAVRGSNPAIS